jgi:hypothetical protein
MVVRGDIKLNVSNMIKHPSKLPPTISNITEDDLPSFKASAIFYTEIYYNHMVVRGGLK